MMRELIYKDEAYKAIDNCIRDGWDRISPSEAKMNIHYLVSDVNEAGKPQGMWVYDEHKNTYVCSECGKPEESFIYGTENWYGRGASKFCSNCGAYMKGVDNEHTV